MSFKNFSNALNVANYINEKKFTYSNVNLPALDTNLILNVAAAASKANLTDSAMAYYKVLADASNAWLSQARSHYFKHNLQLIFTSEVIR